MYSVKDMTEYGFSDKSVKRISEEDYEELVKADCAPRVKDVLIAKDGSVLKHVFSIDSEVKGALLSSIAILRPNPKYVESDYLAYALQDPQLRNDVLSNYVSGSGVPRIVLRDFKNISIRTPSLDIQKGIAQALKSLDKRIQVSIALSKTLEEVAQTLFRSWFVDFDPVRAKMAGEKPVGMDDATAALFPDSMEESELGDIPAGWKWTPLDEIAEISGGKQLSRDEFRDDGLNPVFGGAGEMGRTNLQNADGFVITVGRVGAYCGQFFSYNGSAWVNNNASRLKPRDGYPPEWLFLSLRELDIDSIKKGAAQPYVSNGDLGASNLVVAPQPILENFGDVIGPIFQMKETLEHQVRNLVQIRDSLLPRLISGELQVPEDLVA